MVVLGSLIVAFGWFALNAGCALAGTDLSLSGVVVNTTLAAVAGTLAAMLTLAAKKMKPDPTLICNGMIAGLVAISGPCPFVDSWAAVLVGAVAGSMVVVSVLLLERRGIDDPVGAISVHGVAGLWGLLAVGIFANGKYGAGFNGVAPDGVRGLLYGDPGQFAAQVDRGRGAGGLRPGHRLGLVPRQQSLFAHARLAGRRAGRSRRSRTRRTGLSRLRPQPARVERDLKSEI